MRLEISLYSWVSLMAFCSESGGGGGGGGGVNLKCVDAYAVLV